MRCTGIVFWICFISWFSQAYAADNEAQPQITAFFTKTQPQKVASEPGSSSPIGSSQITQPPPPSLDLQSRGKKRSAEVPNSRDSKRQKRETEVIEFLRGSAAHIETYKDLIDSAEAEVVIASWNLNFIDNAIFRSLMAAKRRGVSISFIVNSVKRERTLDYFLPGTREEDSGYSFVIAETRSHAKFLLVDSRTLVLGSFNALGDSPEEADDASFLIWASKWQVWPYITRIYETYKELGEEETTGVFDGIVSLSAYKHGQYGHLDRTLSCGTRVHLLRTVQEHEEFFRLAVPCNGPVTIYSPFSTRDNTKKRLEFLQNSVPENVDVTLKVFSKYLSGLRRLLKTTPDLQKHAKIENTDSHQKAIILGNETICIGSLNWLSAAQEPDSTYRNLELSVVLQGPLAERIIQDFY